MYKIWLLHFDYGFVEESMWYVEQPAQHAPPPSVTDGHQGSIDYFAGRD